MNDLTPQQINPQETHMQGFEMKPKTLAEAMRFCEIMADSDLVPKDYKGKPGNIMVAIQMGNELGISPMRSLRCIAVINGRAAMWGDDMLAMVLASPLCEYVNETESTDKVGICRLKRKGDPEEHVSTFTLEDAKRAGLLGKAGSWQTNTPRMLKLRARGFGLRDKFADVLAGLVTAEEALDLPTPKDTPTENKPEPTIKDRLKQQLESTEEKKPEPAPEPPAEEKPQEPQPEPEPQQDPPPDAAYKTKLKNAPDSKAINAVWRSIPEELKQDCYNTYSDCLKAMKGK